MLVTFKTKAHANITMFGEVAIELLKLAGLSGTVPTALAADDVPGALAKLEAALAAAPKGAPADADRNRDRARDDEELPVSIGRRAWPLLELLRAAAAAGADVLITPGGSLP